MAGLISFSINIRPAFVLAALIILSSIQQALALCYYPDGLTVATQDTPCETERHSTCCGEGWACLSNNICMLPYSYAPPATYVRSSCTDPTWQDPNCPLFCVITSSGDRLDGDQELRKCDVANQDMYYCHDNNDNNTANVDCAGGNEVLSFAGSPSTITIIGIKAATTSTSSTTSSSATMTVTSSSSATATMPPSPSSYASDQATSSTPDYTVAVGAGVGIPFGLIAVGVLVYLYLRYQKNREAGSHTHQPQNADGSFLHDSKAMQPVLLPVPLAELGTENNPPQELPALTPGTSVPPSSGTLFPEEQHTTISVA